MKKNYFFRLALLLFAVTLGQSVKAQDNPEIADDELTLADLFEMDDDNNYLIYNVEDWDHLAAWIADGFSTSGATFKLESDLPAEDDDVAAIETTIGCQTGTDANSRMRFAGTFDGAGHTIKVNLTSAATNPNYTAPFAYTLNSTIKNLKVEGKITTTGTFAGGLVGSTGPTGSGTVTIDNVEVAVDMECNYLSGDQGSNKYANQSGFVGIAEGGATITNSWFSGKLTGADFAYSAGFIALNKANSTITNCFFVPSEVSATNLYGSSEFYHKNGGNCVLTDCYYTVSFSDDPNLAQGVKVVAELPSGEEGTDYTTVTAPNDVTYYIVKHNSKWVELQKICRGEIEVDNQFVLDAEYIAGSEDGPLVIPSGHTVMLVSNGEVGTVINRGLRHSASKNDGYVIKVEEGATLYMEGLNNASLTVCGGNNKGNGGGILNNGTVIIGRNVTITDNYASKGAGIYNVGELSLNGGNIQIEGNHSDNVYLTSGTVVTLEDNWGYGGLSNSSIGVTAADGANAEITSGLGNIDVTNFFSDDANLFVDVNEEDGEAFLSDEEQPALNLYDVYPEGYETTNTAAIASLNGKKTDVTLNGRTFKSSSWNTLCLPFDATLALLKTVLGNSIQVSEFDANHSSFINGKLTLDFIPVIATNAVIKAGTPFIVKGSSKSSPTFGGVTVKNVLNNVEANGVEFIGAYERFEFPENDQSYRFLSSNKLYYPTTGNYNNPMRAYFHLTIPGEVKSWSLDYGDEDNPTAIEFVEEIENADSNWFDMSGRKLTGKPAQKGIYVNGGKKVIIK